MTETYSFGELTTPVEKIAIHSIQSVLKGEVYDPSRVGMWIDEITKIALEELSNVSTNFKYAVSCMVIQKRGAGLDCATVAHWDCQTDAVVHISWDENRTISCILSIFGVAI
mmetsp:Transcript_12272/g.14817  ORF Transcript_12272/g.14817 Transcript_12272/m.14817 type:complete len:112 (+) Transcript_12272:91-426(+)